MTSDILIGIDVGSTVLKTAAFDGGSGKCLATAGVRLELRVRPDGAREQSPASLDRALRNTLADLRLTLGRRWKRIAGIGLAAQGGSAIVVERDTGRALTPMMLWNDTRSIAHMARVLREATPSFWRHRTLRDVPGAGLAKILWLKDRRPDVMTAENMYVGAGEYCFFRLTGVWRQDACNALQIGCYNAADRRLDPRLMDFCGMPLSFVAPLRNGHESHPLTGQAAARLGLGRTVRVAGPYMDHEAGYLSALGVSKRPLQCSLGTAWVGNFALPPNARWNSPIQLVLPALTGTGSLVVQPLLTGNVTWDWGLAHFVARDHEAALRGLHRIFTPPFLPPDGLVALPWLNFPNPLRPGSIGAAAFFGMNPQTSANELIRALAAGMCYEMARVFEQVLTRRKADSVVLGGGASKGRFFRMLLAALFDPTPVYSVLEPDLSGARGSVFAFSSNAARSRAVRVKPNPPGGCVAKRIDADYAYYKDVFDRFCGQAPVGRPIRFE